MPKIMTVLGSPRKKGNSTILAAKLAEGATGEGADVEEVYLPGLDIKPCNACGQCLGESATGCVIQDDMTPLYPKLADADVLVIASPVYWFNFSAQMKPFLDRLFAVSMGEKNIFKGKRLALILTFAAADPIAAGAGNVVRIFQDIARFLDVKIEGTLLGGGVYGPGEIQKQQDVLDKVTELGKQLATMR